MSSPLHIIASAPDWQLSGANTFLALLLRTLGERGHRTEFVLTHPHGRQELLSPPPDSLSITRFPATRWDRIRLRQRWLKDFLEERKPCVYLPNYDFDVAGVARSLSPEIVVAGILHSDESLYYEAAKTMADCWNGIVPVSEWILQRFREHCPGYRGRLERIPYGTEPTPNPPGTKAPGAPLQVAYCGRLSQRQKRIFDLAEVIETVRQNGDPVEFVIMGGGPDEEDFRTRVMPAIESGMCHLTGTLSHTETLRRLASADATILTSDFEGLPVILLEAMAAGVIPVVTNIKSGVNELVRDDRNGFLLDIGDTGGFVERLQRLARDTELRSRLAREAWSTIANGPYSIDETATRYEVFFQRLFDDVANDAFKRPNGKPHVPDHFKYSVRIKKRLRRLLDKK